MDTGIAFWLFIAVVTISGMWTSFLSRLEAEKTIRLAIERGAALDADAIDRLKTAAATPSAARLMVWGLTILFAAAGIFLVALFIGHDEPDALFPIFGLGALCGMIGLGLLASAFWLFRRASPKSQ